MGYTHYFEANRKFSDEEWDALVIKTKIILSHCEGEGIIVRFDHDQDAPAQVDASRIHFNGYDVGGEDLGHETFVINRCGYSFCSEFCKTAYKPYDLAVTLVLLAVHEVAPGARNIKSDGDWDSDDWYEARRVYKELFGTDPHPPLIK